MLLISDPPADHHHHRGSSSGPVAVILFSDGAVFCDVGEGASTLLHPPPPSSSSSSVVSVQLQGRPLKRGRAKARRYLPMLFNCYGTIRAISRLR